MRINLEELSTQLNKNLSSIYLIAGKEPFLAQEATKTIASFGQKQGFIETHRFSIQHQFDWSLIQTEWENFSLFASKKIMILQIYGKLSDEGKKTLAAYAKKPNPDCLTIVLFHDLDNQSTKLAWFKQLEDLSVFIQIWPISREQFPRYLDQRAKQKSLKLEPAALHILAEHFSGNLLAADQELDKLSLIYPNDLISAETIEAICHEQSNEDIYLLVDAILKKNKTLSGKILAKLQAEAFEPTIMLWALCRDIRFILILIEQGQAGYTSLKRQGLWDKRIQFLQQAARHYNANQLKQALSNTARIDQIIKGVRLGNFWLEYQELVSQLML